MPNKVVHSNTGRVLGFLVHPRTVLAVFAFLIWIFLTVDAAFPYIQMYFSAGAISVPTIALKIIFTCTVVFAALIGRHVAIPRTVFGIWLLMVACLFVNFVSLQYLDNLSPEYLVFSYNALYSTLLVLPLIFAVEGRISQDLAEKLLFWLGIFLILLGLLQFLFNSPLMPIESANGYFQIKSWNFFGKVRSFSLFSSSAAFGGYLTFFVPFCLTAALHSRGPKRLAFLLATFSALVAAYATLTRAVYLSVGASILTLVVLMVPRLRPFRMVLLAVYAAMGALVIFAAPLLGVLLNSSHIGSEASLVMRYDEWHRWIGVWMHSAWNMLFGTGLIQNQRFALTQDVVIDNTYLAVGLQGGIVALGLVLMLMTWMTKYLYSIAIESGSALLTGFACAFSVWPLAASFNIVLSQFALLFVGAILLARTGLCDHTRASARRPIQL